ncbi:MAG: hypothetical protein ACT4O5_09710 [Gammaproteobacteria bacterium]
MAATRTGALWFGLGTFLTLLVSGALDIYVLGKADPMVGPSISFHISLWFAAGGWLLAAFAFAAGAHRFKSVGAPTRSFLLGVAISVLWLTALYSRAQLPDSAFEATAWILLVMFAAACFVAPKFAASRRAESVG